MNPWVVMAVGAAAGAALGHMKGEREKRAADTKRKRDKKRESQIAKWTPWTGMQAARVSEQRVDPINAMLQGGIVGAQMGQNVWSAGQFSPQATPNAVTNTPQAATPPGKPMPPQMNTYQAPPPAQYGQPNPYPNYGNYA